MTISSAPNEPIVYQLTGHSKARGLTAIDSTEGEHRFITATCNPLESKNEASEATNQVSLEFSRDYQHPLIAIASCDGVSSKMTGISVFRKGNEVRYSLCALDTSDASQARVGYDEVATFTERPSDLVIRSTDEVAVCTPTEVSLFHLGSSTPSKLPTAKCGALAIDSSNANLIAFSSDRSVCLWDTRTNEVSLTMKTSHFFPIQCMACNPNLDNVYVTGGEDGRLLFWDVRHPNGSSPLETVGNAHAHHITSVQYHPIHDQLLISSGTDCAVNLWRYQGVSSTPSKSIPLTSPRSKTAIEPITVIGDGLVESFKRHEDSVYKCTWSREGWAIGSVSYDGLVVINSVPTPEKYRILL